MSYQFYVQDTLSLLNDQGARFTSVNQLTRWINLARRDVAKLTGCIQRFLGGNSALGAGAQPGYMIPGAFQPGASPDAAPASANPLAALSTSQGTLWTITGVERYPYRGFFNPVLASAYAGLKGVIDTVQLAIAWESAFRPALTWQPWDDFQAYCRTFANQTTSYPAVWSVFNDGEEGEIWLFPAPSQPCEMEAYVTCIPANIYSDDDYDAIPDGFKELVKWKAASLSFFAARQYAQSEVMDAAFMQAAGLNVVARDRGKTPSYYWGGF